MALEFFDGLGQTGDCVLFSNSVNLTQKLGSNTKYNYKMKLLVYLASRMKWDKFQDGQYLIISKQYLFKNLDLLGSNLSRNNQILWRTIEELQQEGYLLEPLESPEKQNLTNIQFQINSEKIRCSKSFCNTTDESICATEP